MVKVLAYAYSLGLRSSRRIASRTPDRLTAESETWQARIQTLLAEAKAIDRQEDAQFGPDRGGGALSEELAQAQSRKKKIEAALKQLKDRGNSKINLTDPDAQKLSDRYLNAGRGGGCQVTASLKT